jgi:endonuclease G
MNLADVLNDAELKAELLEVLRPVVAGGGSLGLIGRLDASVPKGELRALAEQPARAGHLPLLNVGEAIIRRFGRPVLFVRGNSLHEQTVEDPESRTWLTRLRAARKWLDAAFPAVGRVELRGDPEHAWVGTGWLVGPATVVTNRHVADVFARRGEGGFVFRHNVEGQPVRASINFRVEHLQEEEHEFRLTKVLHIDDGDGPDLALLQAHPQSALGDPPGAPIPLGDEAPVVGQEVAVIGYPGRDDRRNDPLLVDLLFGGVYGVKRLAPGKVMTVHPEYFTHDCSTLGGNSGSVVLDLGSGKALGLHFGGSYREANYAVPAARIAEGLAALPRP